MKAGISSPAAVTYGDAKTEEGAKVIRLDKPFGALVRVAVAALAFSPAFASAQSQSWRQSSASPDLTAFIDTSSITHAGDKVRFWRELRRDEPGTLEGGERYDRIASHIEADCRALTLRNLELYIRLGDREIARSLVEEEMETVQPGTNAALDVRAACTGEWPQ